MSKKIRIKHEKTEAEIAEEKRIEEEAAELEEKGVQDEFQAKGFEMAEWAQTHSSTILAALGILVVIGLGIGFNTLNINASNMDAADAFNKGIEAYRAPLGDAPALLTGGKKGGLTFKDEKARSTESRTRFEKVAADFNGNEVAKVANLYIGHSSMRLEDYDRAIEAYQVFLKATDNADSLRFAALEGLAYSLEAKGDSKAAVARLEELVALPGTLNEDIALMKLGRIYKKGGNDEQAKKAFQKIVDEHSTSPLKSKASALLGTFKKVG
ncbi:MAG: tetratricopeptide repeat protein [Deltaproteobacteria bacterium]|nr:tetratricopeptide repeat protein [Deltaproteobacteria bacterium]